MSRCGLWGQSLYVSTAGKYSKSSRVRCHHYVVVCCPIPIHPLGRDHRASWKGGEECSLYSKLGKIPWIVLENFFHTYKPLYNLNNLQCVGHWFVTNPPSVPQLSIFGVTPPPPSPAPHQRRTHLHLCATLFVLTTFCHHLWSITEQPYSNMESIWMWKFWKYWILKIFMSPQVGKHTKHYHTGAGWAYKWWRN